MNEITGISGETKGRTNTRVRERERDTVSQRQYRKQRKREREQKPEPGKRTDSKVKMRSTKGQRVSKTSYGYYDDTKLMY